MEHDHSHGFSTRRDVTVSLWIVGFAALELAVGVILLNPAIVADAAHGFLDVFGTVISTVTKLVSRSRSSHRMRYHVPVWVGMGICATGVVLIGWVAYVESSNYIPVTIAATLIAGALGAVGCVLRYRLASYMSAGKGATDVFNSRHLRSDAETSWALLISGVIALSWRLVYPNSGPTFPEWVFRVGVFIIMIKVVRDNWHTIRDNRRQLAACVDCNKRPTS